MEGRERELVPSAEDMNEECFQDVTAGCNTVLREAYGRLEALHSRGCGEVIRPVMAQYVLHSALTSAVVQDSFPLCVVVSVSAHLMVGLASLSQKQYVSPLSS